MATGRVMGSYGATMGAVGAVYSAVDVRSCIPAAQPASPPRGVARHSRTPADKCPLDA